MKKFLLRWLFFTSITALGVLLFVGVGTLGLSFIMWELPPMKLGPNWDVGARIFVVLCFGTGLLMAGTEN